MSLSLPHLYSAGLAVCSPRIGRMSSLSLPTVVFHVNLEVSCHRSAKGGACGGDIFAEKRRRNGWGVL